ncbi:MAG: site-2 protease family protein [Nanoarchaeota archaeon]|nr:site-2 protease family protein [Nanoarchaeota archaeon]
MNFMVYDLIFLVVFAIAIAIFLYSRRKGVKKEGMLLLYRTQVGIKLINYAGKKYKKILYALSYISIFIGYLLMVGAVYLVGRIVYLYVAFPQVVKAMKIPPIMPLIPYLPSMFKLNFLPPFYFTYWIIVLAIIAITHEFSHGIFGKRFGIRIKSTGFGFFPFFLPVFLAAFVEQDDKQMAKKDKFSQMAMLSAGTFANVLTAIFFFVILLGLFSVAFMPIGVEFDTYAYSIVSIGDISSINGGNFTNLSYENMLDSLKENETSRIIAGNASYLATKDFLKQQKDASRYVILYDDAPAINANLTGVITEIDGVPIKNKESLSEELLQHSPGDKVGIKTKTGEESLSYEIILSENPNNNNTPWLGIGFYDNQKTGMISKTYLALSYFKEDGVKYEPKFGGITIFIYNLVWWIVLISISVALVNMLPVGIFDGGRFFYLTILAITKKEKIAKNVFSFMTYLFLIVLLVLMIIWGYSFFA